MRSVLLLIRNPGRVLGLIAALAGAAIYVWRTAVLAVPGVRRRKAAGRAAQARQWKD